MQRIGDLRSRRVAVSLSSDRSSKRSILKAWLHEMVLRLGPSVVMYANQFPNADPNLVRAFQEFGTDLILGFKNHDE